jgi:hypothetical protein
MSDSIRKQILDSVGTVFKTINGTGSYTTSFTGSIFDTPPGTVESQSLPCILYRDAGCRTYDSNTKSGIPYDTHEHELSVEAEVKVTGTATDIRKAIADVNVAIGTQAGSGGRWGGLATMTVPDGDAIAIDIQDQQYISAIIKFTITFRTAAWDPYTAR